MTTDAGDPTDKVGYGKPPKEHQFKPGQSGCPTGRPKKVVPYEDLVRRVGNKRVVVNGEDGPQSISAIEAILTRRAQKALQGTIGDSNKFTDDYRKSTQGLDATDEVSAADREAAIHIMQTYRDAERRQWEEEAAKAMPS